MAAARTPAQLAAIRAFDALVQADGADETHEFLIELGDMFSLWPEEQPLPADDISELAARLICKGMTTVAIGQRAAFLRAVRGHVDAGLTVMEAA